MRITDSLAHQADPARPPAAAQLGLALILALHALPGGAANLSVQVSDSTGLPVADDVVYAEPASGQPIPKPGRQTEIEQINRKFLPSVTVIQAGTSIAFPNNDTVRHHVYSFSPAKTFEIKLYSGEPANPVHFDKPGTVVIGCNIHDQMAAYIHVVPTPYFAKTDALGKARLERLPPGKYQLKTWHHAVAAGVPISEQALSLGVDDAGARFTLNMKAGMATH